MVEQEEKGFLKVKKIVLIGMKWLQKISSVRQKNTKEAVIYQKGKRLVEVKKDWHGL